ncbi:hypothetical protein NSPZN2_100452 [Nitrospira defluvii]|uniref:Transposase n=1 Tax=Nitrospira defluvii TaxID=330214 RepID=A0ABM8R4S4_9BACT|nr:hypothetical protein NSPZN2_100452 [Nitrospira defluvii]
MRRNVDEERTTSHPSLLGLEDVDRDRAKDGTQGDGSNHELQDSDKCRIEDVHGAPLKDWVPSGWPC